MKFLEIGQPDFTEAGDALVALIKRRIQSAPGGRWNKTGRLLNSIHAEVNKGRVVVVASGDRLQRDDLAEKFAAEILSDSSVDAATRGAIAVAVFGAIKANNE